MTHYSEALLGEFAAATGGLFTQKAVKKAYVENKEGIFKARQ